MSEPILTHRVDGPSHGDPLLLLNGGFMTMASWEPCAAPLAEDLRVIRCDFRGQLLTPGPAHRELDSNAVDVVALLDHLGLDSVHLLGTSFGGEVGLLLAARYPERVRSLIVVAVTDYTTEAMSRGARELRRIVEEILADGDRGRFHDVLVKEVYSREHVEENRATLAERREQIASLPEPWFHALDDLLAAVEEFDLRPELGGIRCLVLVVVAGEDRIMPPERGRALAEALPDGRLVEHSTSGHALVAEEPAWLVETTRAFLEDLPERG